MEVSISKLWDMTQFAIQGIEESKKGFKEFRRLEDSPTWMKRSVADNGTVCTGSID